MFVLRKPLTTTSGVQAWALGGISAQLKAPIGTILQDFSPIVSDGVGGAAKTAAIGIAVVVGSNIVHETYNAVTIKRVGGEGGKGSLPMIDEPLAPASTA